MKRDYNTGAEGRLVQSAARAAFDKAKAAGAPVSAARPLNMEAVRQRVEAAMAEASSALDKALDDFRSADFERAAHWLGRAHAENDKARTYLMNFTHPHGERR